MASRFLEVETEARECVPCPSGSASGRCSWTEPRASPPELAEKRALGIHPDARAVPGWLESPAEVQTQLYWNCPKMKQTPRRWECWEASETLKCLLSEKTAPATASSPVPHNDPAGQARMVWRCCFQTGKLRHRADTQPGLGAHPVDSNCGHCFPRPLPTRPLRGWGSWGGDLGHPQQLQPFCLESWTKEVRTRLCSTRSQSPPSPAVPAFTET